MKTKKETRGGTRKGAGAKPKYTEQPFMQPIKPSKAMNINVQIKRIKSLLQGKDREEIQKRTGLSRRMIDNVLANEAIYPSTIPVIEAALSIFEERKKQIEENANRLKALKK